MNKIDHYYQRACEEASKEVQKLARKILNDNPDLYEFVMCMGSWFFTNTHGDILGYEDERFKPLDDIISEWDNHLKITGEPMRFTAKGQKVTSWGAKST